MKKIKNILALFILLTSTQVVAYWTPDSNNITAEHSDLKRSNFSLARTTNGVPDPVDWTIELSLIPDITLFELNSYGGWDVGYSYKLAYDFGEGIDVASNGYSNPQLMSRADLQLGAKAWIQFTGPGVWVDLWGVSNEMSCNNSRYNLCLDIFNLLGANININEKIFFPPTITAQSDSLASTITIDFTSENDIDFTLPFLDDNNPAINMYFSSGIYDNDYSQTIYIDLAEVLAAGLLATGVAAPLAAVVRVVDINIGVARGLDTNVDIGLRSIDYYETGNSLIGSQTSADSGADVSSKAGTTLNVDKRTYNIGTTPVLGAGAAIYTEIGIFGYSIAVYYPLEGSDPPHLVRAEVTLPVPDLPVTIGLDTSYTVPSAQLPASLQGNTNTFVIQATNPANGDIVGYQNGTIINCGNSCNASVDQNSIVSLYANAISGFGFNAWSGACAGQNNPCSIVADSAKSIGVSFIDTQPPSITPPVDITIVLSSYTTQLTSINLGNATVADNVDTNLQVTASPTGPFTIGRHQVIWSATDQAGNKGLAAQTIIVKAPVNAMRFISETVVDDTVFTSNATFTKTWTVRNAGETTWNNSYCLTHSSGTALGTVSSVCVVGTVAPSNTYTFSVIMQALQNSGTYRDNWRLGITNSLTFSGDIWAQIVVNGASVPSVPVIIPSLTSFGSGVVYFSWNAVPNATIYRIERSNTQNGSYSQITTATITGYTDSGLTPSNLYYYRMRACIDDSNENTCSGYSSVEGLSSGADSSITPPNTGGSTATYPLNDTGLYWGGNYSSGNNTTCTSNIPSPQDCNYGRDAAATAGQLTKVGGGSAGFDFTKLDSNGNALSSSASSWSCVKDNVTGLVWEVKTNVGAASTTANIHHKDNTYRWGGLTAIGRGHSARLGSYYDDWDTLVNGSNNQSLCGFTNWRVPSINELDSIVDLSRTNPVIDTNYFPNTPTGGFWSASPYASYSYYAWRLGFFYGNDHYHYRYYGGRVRLVRSGQ